MGGTPSGFIAFSLPNPSRHEPPSFSPNITHPNIWCRGTPTPYVRPDAGTVNPLEREHARGKLRRPIIQEPSVRRPGPPQFNPNVKHPNAATTNLNARPIVGPPSGPLVFGPPPPPVNQTQTPSSSPDIAHPNIWRQGIPASYVSPEAVTMERLQHENALRKMRSPITQKQNVRLIKLPCFKLSNAEATKFLPNPIPTVPSTFAERRAVRLTNTDPSGVAGPAKVVTTVTRTPQRAISASEVFREVRDCVIEYLGSDVQK